MFRFLALVLIVVLTACGGEGPSSENVRTMTYCGAQRMEIHGERPGAQPAVLYVHGGGWESGDRTTGFERRMIAPLTAAGIVVTTIDYRLAPAALHPTQAQDVACAVRFMRANANALGIDPSRIGIMGDSAGGHLAALIALNGDRYTSPDWAGTSSDVSAVAAFYGAFDLVNVESSLAQGAIAQNFPTAASRIDGSPVRYVDASAPPFLIAHGKQDRFVNVAQSVKLALLLQQAGHEPLLVAVENAGHGFVPRGGTPTPSVAQITQLLVAFFSGNL